LSLIILFSIIYDCKSLHLGFIYKITGFVLISEENAIFEELGHWTRVCAY